MKNPGFSVLSRPLLVGGSAVFLSWTSAAAEIVACGAGSYTTRRPDTCKELPATIYRSAAQRGPVTTGQWWSSLLWQEHSANLFPHPLGMSCTPDGLAVTYPGAALVASADAIMGGGVDQNGDLKISHSACSDFPKTVSGGHSDWFVTALFEKGDAVLSTTFGHGSPFVYGTIRGGAPVIRLAEKPVLWSAEKQGPTLGITVRGRHYGLFGASGSTWSGTDGLALTNDSNDKGYFSIALLPDNQAETLALFAKYAHHHVTDTRVSHRVQGGKVEVDHRFVTKAMEGEGSGTLFALYPHQWKYTDLSLSGKTYNSVRGLMKLGEGTGFKTSVPVQGVLPALPVEGIRDKERMLGFLKKKAAAKFAPFADTYWEGKYLGKLATLSGIADAMGELSLRDVFTAEIKRRLENWFTASPGETEPLFHYNSTWGSMIGSKPSYGSDMPLNDHHFHYGYFIRAAAEVARHEPAWAEKWGPMVKLLIRDIASPDRADPMFPHLRCFDRYAGHSWASGDANFADGNNQESSSESLNAWYGMMLWGEATGDKALRDFGVYLFNTERTAVEEYWFDVSDTNFPKDFPQVALGMVWGGKGAFATWFSGDIDCIHGINWLPFTPASIYMGRHPDYVKRNADRIISKRPGARDFNTGWGDLVVMFNALTDPAMASAWFEANPDCKIEGGNLHAFMDHWIGTLDKLGTNDASVTADHPFFNVFTRDGGKTHAAHNFGAAPITVAFSDGVKLSVPPRSTAVSTQAK
jgi:endoglucanase Acf2